MKGFRSEGRVAVSEHQRSVRKSISEALSAPSWQERVVEEILWASRSGPVYIKRAPATG